MKRNHGIAELNGLTDEISWIEWKVKETNFIQQRYFWKQYNKQMDKINDDYMCMTIECQYQLTNYAYENLVDFVRHPSVKKYFDR